MFTPDSGLADVAVLEREWRDAQRRTAEARSQLERAEEDEQRKGVQFAAGLRELANRVAHDVPDAEMRQPPAQSDASMTVSAALDRVFERAAGQVLAVDEVTARVRHLGVSAQDASVRSLLSRAVTEGRIVRAGRGRYLAPVADPEPDLFEDVLKGASAEEPDEEARNLVVVHLTEGDAAAADPLGGPVL